MTTAVIVGRQRPDLAERCLLSLGNCSLIPKTVFVVNGCDETTKLVQRFPWVNVIVNEWNAGFWVGVNQALERIGLDEPFCYFGQDVVFDRNWLKPAENMFRAMNGAGLLTFKDGIQDGKNASHGMSTRKWVYIIYGKPYFPSDQFTHFYLDSEFTQRSVDMGRYVYCEESLVMHKHEPSGHQLTCMGKDKEAESRRYQEWLDSAKAETQERMLLIT